MSLKLFLAKQKEEIANKWNSSKSFLQIQQLPEVPRSAVVHSFFCGKLPWLLFKLLSAIDVYMLLHPASWPSRRSVNYFSYLSKWMLVFLLYVLNHVKKGGSSMKWKLWVYSSLQDELHSKLNPPSVPISSRTSQTF